MFMNYFKKNFSIRKTNLLLLILVAMDIIFVLGHALVIYLIFRRVEFDWSISNMLRVDYDGGYPEIFQYLKYILIIIAIIYIMYQKKEYNYLSWLLLFILLFFDDALRFHEYFGGLVSERFNYKPMFGLGTQDLGELTYVALFGPLVLLVLFLGYRNGNEKYKKTNLDLVLLFSLFLFFGIVIDMLHVLFNDNRYTKLIMVLLEDGGEMLALSLLSWYFFFIVFRSEIHDKYIYKVFSKNKV